MTTSTTLTESAVLDVIRDLHDCRFLTDAEALLEIDKLLASAGRL